MVSLLGRVDPLPLVRGPDVESVVVEVKRLETRFVGFGQLETAIYEAGDLYDAGYVCAPLLEGESASQSIGTLSLSRNGEISMVDASNRPSRYSTPESERLRREELRHVLASFKMELLKNVGLRQGVQVVTGGDKLTYQQFVERLAEVEPERILELVESRL